MSTELELDTPVSDESTLPTASVDAAEHQELPVTMIRPPRRWQLLNVRELWQYRELLYFLTWRDVKVRYKQTLLGAAWAVLQPAMMMVVFSIFFGRMAQVSSGDWPYPIFVYAGLLPWTFFATAIANAGNSVVGSERMITKIYFPRLAIPMAAVGAALVDFAVACGLLLILMVYYSVPFTWTLLLLPVLMVLITLAGIGVGALLAALNVAYRDFRYVIPFLVQLWLFATPTVYMQPGHLTDSAHLRAGAATDSTAKRPVPSPSARTARDEAVPDSIQQWLNLNPMVGLIAFFRSAALGGELPWTMLGYSSLGVVVAFVIGCLYFRHVEDSFADII
jgi:lipopolysaccharide transport system permease protein